MAFQKVYSDQSGNDYPVSYWRVVQVNFSPVDEAALVMFYCYKDQASRLAGKQSVGQKSYSVGKPDYPTYFSVANLDLSNPIEQGYLLCKNVKDIDSGTKDANGLPIMKSFFNGAIDV